MAQKVGGELQQGFGPIFAPEHFAAFDAVVQLLDGRLDVAGRNGQALPVACSPSQIRASGDSSER